MKWLPFFLCISVLFAVAERPKPRVVTPNIVPTAAVVVKVPTENIVLTYDEQLEILDPATAWEKVSTAVIDMPTSALRGQLISVTVNIPTIVQEVSGVTVVIGYMSSDLHAIRPGVYAGRIEISEMNERGVNRVQYYFRSAKGKTAMVEKLIRVN